MNKRLNGLRLTSPGDYFGTIEGMEKTWNRCPGCDKIRMARGGVMVRHRMFVPKLYETFGPEFAMVLGPGSDTAHA